MTTFGDMQTNIATFLRRDDLSTEIPIAIKRAIKHYTNEPWPWLEERNTSLTTTANTKTVAPPSDFGADLQLLITVNSFIYPLCKTTQQQIEEWYVQNDFTNQPSHYSYWDGNFYLYPIPDATYSLTLNYYEDLAELSSASDTNSWTTTAEEMIEARAIWWLASRIMRNMDVANMAKQQELEAYNGVRRRATLTESSGKLKTTRW